MCKYEKELDKIGVKINLIGYTLWKEALKYCELKKEETYNYDMGELYQYLAKKHKTSYTCIERNLRHAWQTVENLNEKLKINYKINNSIFLAMILRNVKEDEK